VRADSNRWVEFGVSDTGALLFWMSFNGTMYTCAAPNTQGWKDAFVTAAVVAVDLALLTMHRIRPVLQAARLHPAEDLIELGLAHQERVVLDLDLLVGIEEGERDLVGDLDIEERAERPGPRQVEDLGEELGGSPLVPRVHDGVVQLDRHAREDTGSPGP